MASADINSSLLVLKQWVDALVRRFPTAEIVDHDKNSFTVRIRYDDIFRYFYDDIKKSVNDAKVSLKECEYDEKYKQCMVIKTSHIITNLKQVGFTNVFTITGDGYILYYIPVSDMFDVFDKMWKEANHGKPIRFTFTTRRLTPTKPDSRNIRGTPPTGGTPTPSPAPTVIYHYIKIEFIQVSTA
jgi:hypothetical protein